MKKFLNGHLKILIILIFAAAQHLLLFFMSMSVSVWVHVHMNAGVLGGQGCHIILELTSREVLGVLVNKLRSSLRIVYILHFSKSPNLNGHVSFEIES